MLKEKKFKAVLSAIIALFMICSVMLPVNADIPEANEAAEAPAAEKSADYVKPQMPENLDELMIKALTAVKTIIKIDDKKYPTFNYNYYPGDEYSPEMWYFSWSAADGMANINVNVAGNGKIIYYGKYEYNDKMPRKNIQFAEISKPKAKANADAFLKKVLGDEFKGYRLFSQHLSYPSERYNLVYVLNKNGYDYQNYYVYVDVDKITGEVLNFNRYNYQNTTDKNFNYESASKVITREEALKSYLEQAGLDLVYTSRFDWQTKKLTVSPVYRLKDNYNEYISATTGKLIKLVDNDRSMPMPVTEEAEAMNDSRAMKAGGDAGGVSFSAAELAEIKNLKKYITSDKAIEIVAKAFDLDLGDLSGYQKNINLTLDYINQKQYCWNIYLYRQSEDYNRYENYNATVDARNGNIINYSNYSYSPAYYDYYDYDGSGRIKGYVEPEYIYTYDEVKKIAMDKIKELSPYDIDKNFELVKIIPEYQPMDKTEKSAYYYFNLIRKVNGIKFENNYISISFNNITGKIESYNLTWYEDVTFPKLTNIVSPEKALAAIADFSGYNIYYASNGRAENDKTNAVLIYSFNNNVMVDPFTGKCIDWNFEELKKPEPEPDYKDLDGHWSEKIVKTLADNGIYVWGGEKFDPDKDITKGELLDYLKFYTYNYYFFTEIPSSIFVNSYAYFRQQNNTQDKDLDKALTKQEAAKIICELAGYGELGKHSEIFVYPFADGKCDEQYKGYVAILKAFGLISGDKDGNFNAAENLTRAGAAEIVYNIIMAYNK